MQETALKRIELEMWDEELDQRRYTMAFQGQWLVAPEEDTRTTVGNYDASAYWGVARTAKARHRRLPGPLQ